MNNSTIKTTSTETKLEKIQLHVLGLGAQKQELWKGPNVETFMEAFVDCVECHFHVYKEGGVLPPHLTESNLMFKYGPDGNIRGVLNDWDISSRIEKNGGSQLWKAYHPGTIPFILVWAAINYDFGAAERRKIDFTTAQWDAPTLAHAKRIKQGFMIDYDDMKTEILERVHPKNSVLTPRIDALRLLFFQAHLDRGMRSAKISVEDWDHTTLGGHITFEKFIKAIGREPR